MATIIPHWLTKQAYLSPDQGALETEHAEGLTFLELKEKSESYARKLAHSGVQEGDHIGIFSSNDLKMVVALHALSYLGAVSVMLNTRLTEAELTYQLTDAQVTMVLVDDDYEAKVKQMEFKNIVQTFSEVGEWQESPVSLKEELNLNDIFTIIYTSGTTGLPKGVVHTYGNYWWSAMGSAINLGLHKDDKWLAVLPLFHIGGLSILIRSVIYGIPVYLLRGFSEEKVHQAIIKEGITIASVVTVMVQRLIHSLAGRSYPDSLRCMLLGGGPAPRPLLEQAKQLNIPVFQSYGMTETTSQIATLSPDDALQKLGSAGKPLLPGQLKIKNKQEDAVGEIFVKGPMVTNEYFNHDKANKESFHEGWLATGDLGYLDHEGFLYVVERRTDLIISGGENVYPSEIESVLTGMKQIQEVGVLGKEDSTWGQIPVAFIVTNEEKLTEKAIRDYAKEYLASYKIPKEIYFIDQLPRNASNKLVRNKLVEWLSEK